MNRLAIAATAAIVVVILIAGASLFTVAQTEQVLVTQFGQPVRVIRDPGLHAKIPFVQTVIGFDNRLLDFNTAGEEVILADQRRLTVDSFTRYRITDPLRFFQAAGPSEDGIRGRLNSVVTSALRRVLGNETLLNVLSADRNRIMGLIKTQVSQEMRSFGVDIDDVRIRRADLPEENTQAILARMKSERERVASQLRAEGAEAAAKIRADAERDRTVLLADARSSADKLRGQGEQQAIDIYAGAAKADPDFFITYRTLQAYRQAFAQGHSRLVLTPETDFLRLLRQQPASN
ncbi:MAG: protease modulator HflC [Acetobacteraceae bacterium]|nr:protease modulator HflC [Acetobacteraceae bacterium]